MWRKWSVLLLPLCLLTACQEAPAPRKVSLVLDWYPNAVHSFLLAAQQQGYFRDEGLEVELKMPADNPTDGIKLVGAGQETFALYYQPDVLMARSEGIPIVSVAAIVRRPLNGIMVPAGSGIRSPKELEGRRVGYPSTPLSLHMVETMVSHAGGDPARVTMTDVSWDLIPALATDQVDAVIGAYINHEQVIWEKQGLPITYFAPADFGVPSYYELVLITGEQVAREDRATVQAMLRAMAKGQAWVKQHPDEALRLLLEQQDQNFPLDPEVEERSLAILLPLMEEHGLPFGAQKAEDWERVRDWLVQGGLIKPEVKAVDAHVDVGP